ncbi:hypothetical protein SAMN02745166_01838 [Prosthecobacter debontii]|uniref:Uncharacterized protein n=1 Tax=Prosthecobacter debontii TaxID=48467 RepID=A0A1T4XRB6_9BACT|nr:hypothetical protein [Prosthecobacter debontii]SKA92090.1 hypothetical protein SAMN02745166_01838 [Prosthecobacter debontii]
MLLDEIKSVLSFDAFKPEADDASVSWGRRFEGRKTLLLNVSRNQTSWRGINKKGRFDDGGVMEGEFADIAPQRADEWRMMADGGWCVVSINNRFIMSLENNMMRGDNCVNLLRTNPRAVLGPKFDRGKRYAICHHPETSASMLLACEESMVKVTEDVLRTIGIRPGRVCCGLFALNEYAVHQLYVAQRGSVPPNMVLVSACEGSIGVLVQQDGQWKELRCRSGLGPDAVETSLQIISPLLQKVPQGSPVYFISEGQDAKFRADLFVHLERVGAVDMTQDDILWRAIGIH